MDDLFELKIYSYYVPTDSSTFIISYSHHYRGYTEVKINKKNYRVVIILRFITINNSLFYKNVFFRLPAHVLNICI